MPHIHRTAHFGTLIHRALVNILQRHISDPKLQQLTLTYVKVSKKLDYADINFTQLNTHFNEIDTLKSLKKANSRIRYYLSQELIHLRTIPRLRFHYDTGLVKSMLIYEQINKAISSKTNEV